MHSPSNVPIEIGQLSHNVVTEQRGHRLIRVTTTTKRISKKAIDRQSWKKFGEAVHNNNCTFVDQTIHITNPNQDANDVNIKPNNQHFLKESSVKSSSRRATSPKPFRPFKPKRYTIPQEHADDKERIPFVTVKVSNIPETLTEKWLRTLGNNVGRVCRCKIPRDIDGKLLNFAFVSFLTTTDANAFVQYVKGKSMDYCILDAKITER